jgi:hypothetical protein
MCGSNTVGLVAVAALRGSRLVRRPVLSYTDKLPSLKNPRFCPQPHRPPQPRHRPGSHRRALQRRSQPRPRSSQPQLGSPRRSKDYDRAIVVRGTDAAVPPRTRKCSRLITYMSRFHEVGVEASHLSVGGSWIFPSINRVFSEQGLSVTEF